MFSALPWPRAMSCAVVITALGLVAHGSAADHRVSPWAVVAFLVGVTLILRAAQGRPGSRTRLVALLALGQVGFHLLLSPGHATGPAHATIAGHGGHETAVGLRRSVAPMAPVIADWLAAGVLGLVTQPAMLIAHLGAAIGAGCWLARGETVAMAAMAAVASLFRVHPVGSPRVAGHAPPPVVRAQPRSLTPRSLLLGRSLARRGPPAMCQGLLPA